MSVKARCSFLSVLLGVLIPSVFSAPVAVGERLYLVRQSRPAAMILYGVEDRPAADRVQRRIREWTGVELAVKPASAEPSAPMGTLILLIGSPKSNPAMRDIFGSADLINDLGEEGLLVRTAERDGGHLLVLAGATRLGATFATGEFLNWHLRVEGNNAWVEPMDVTARPALPKRLVWSSVGGANWAADFAEMHARQIPTGMAAALQDEASYLDHTFRMIDFLAEHKFNGAIFWGFVGSATGGVEPARKMSRYAKENGIRILPLIGTGTYGGFFHGNHEFSIATWAKTHAKARCLPMGATQPADDSVAAGLPESTKFFRDGAEWLFSTFPDIGGVNLENGDWMSCWNPECATEKEKPENDPNFYWDMMASQRDIIEIGLKHQPDAWMTFATYTPFTKQLILRDLNAAIKQKLAKAAVYPPRFLDQVDPRSIAQWTVTGMHSTYLWPDDAAPPPGRLKHHIAFTHLNSFYGTKCDPARWWAEPNATFDEGSPILFFQIPQAIKTGFEGFAIKGFIGDTSPANELFYLAVEELMWNPESTSERFIETRLAKIYGGIERATAFLAMLRNTTKDPKEILADQTRATAEVATTASDPRVARRWRNLASELGRRADLAARPAEAK